jgi:hypothetical protein
MEIKKGFQIFNPNFFVPWTIKISELDMALKGFGLKKLSDIYATINCEPFSGATCDLDFRFEGPGNSLNIIQLSRGPSKKFRTQTASFHDFQKHLEKAFGQPHEVTDGEFGVPNCIWRWGNIELRHDISEHFGAEEHLRFIKFQ